VIRDPTQTAYVYEGNFVAIVDPNANDSEIQLVNLVESETYIQGVVPSEMGDYWPIETLKSQAVAARTYAWWTVTQVKRGARPSEYDLDDTVQYQAYLGNSTRSKVSDSAVTSTNKLVMKYNGEVIKSFFSADSGGYTESAEHGFTQVLPYCQSKKELYDVSRTATVWVLNLSLAKISAALNQTIQRIEVLAGDVDESGRVLWVTLNGQTKISGAVFRQKLKLRSTLFQLELQSDDSIKLSGAGFGHGVGLAQIGAREYVNQLAWDFEQIVKFYYTGITLEVLN